jgi:hypothetical protein
MQLHNVEEQKLQKLNNRRENLIKIMNKYDIMHPLRGEKF